MTDFPEIGYGTVHGRFLVGVLDDDDPVVTPEPPGFIPELAPDAEPLSGSVTFAPTAPVIAVVSAAPAPATFFPQPLTVKLDEEGYLSRNDSRDIGLWATDDQSGNPYDWQWRVTFNLHYKGRGVYRAPFNFELPAGETIDLTVVAPVVTPSPGTIIIQGPPGEDGVDGVDGEDGAPGDSHVPPASIGQTIVGRGGPSGPVYGYKQVSSPLSPDSLILRDDAGRAQIFDPAAAWDIANKGYVDTAVGAAPGGETQYNTEAELNAEFTPGRGVANVVNEADWPTWWSRLGGYGPQTLMVETAAGNGPDSFTQKVNTVFAAWQRSSWDGVYWQTWFAMPIFPAPAFPGEYLTSDDAGVYAEWRENPTTVLAYFSDLDGLAADWAFRMGTVQFSDLGAESGLTQYGQLNGKGPFVSGSAYDYVANHGIRYQTVEIGHPTEGVDTIYRQWDDLAGVDGAWSPWVVLEAPASGDGLKEYADIAAVGAVRQTEVGIWHTENLAMDVGADVGNPSWLKAKPADIVVTSTRHGADSGTTLQLLQTFQVIQDAGFGPEPITFSRHIYFSSADGTVYETAPWSLRPFMPGPSVIYTPGISPLAFTVLGGTDGGTAWGYYIVSPEPEVGYTTIMMRDGAGRSQVATPAVADDIANKGYVDAGVASAVAAAVAALRAELGLP